MSAAAAALAAFLLILAPALAHAGAPAGRRHLLAPVASAAALPPAVATPLRSWMALRGERWNSTDSIGPGELTAGYEWAGRSGANWIVAYKVGGVACCSTRFTLLVPHGDGYVQATVLPGRDRPDWFGDPSCAGIDAALSAYAGGR
jgi:hypothetical protein